MRPGPLFIAAAAVVGGELSALATAPSPLPPAIATAAAAALLLPALYPHLRRRTGTDARISVAACVGACFAAGAAVGSASGRASRAACTAALETGDRVYLEGRPASPPKGQAARRVRLLDVQLSGGPGRCRIPRLTVLLTGAPEDSVRSPDRLRARGTWRRYGDRKRGGARPPDRYGYVKGRPIVGSGTADGGRGPLERIRLAAAARLQGRMPPDVRGLATAMLLADRSDISPLWSRRFAQSGLAHLLAISGLHVGILAGLCTGLFSLIGAGRWRYPLAGVTIAAYVLAIGAPPAAMRAGFIFALYAAARHRGSPRRFTDLVGAAAIVALLGRPLVLLEPGFQLSFAGFLGVAAGNRSASRWERAARTSRWMRAARPPRAVGAGFRLAVIGTAAFLATAPFAALHFQRAAPIAIVSSWVGTPLVALALPALVGALALPGPLAAICASAATALLAALAGAVSWLAELPFGHGGVAPPRPDQWLAFGLLALGAAAFATGQRPGRALWPALVALALWLGGPVVVHAPLRGRTLLCSLAVGQGDAAVIRTRRGNWVIIDAGPFGGSRSELLRFLRRHDADGVELLTLSHPHADHMAGVPDLLEAYRVRRILDAGNPLPSERYAEFLEAIEAEGANWLLGRAGAELQVDEVRIQVLGPILDGDSIAGPLYADANEASLSLRVAIRSFVYVNTGDAPVSQEAEMADRWPAHRLRADLLKLGHHGSRTSSSVRWLRVVDPRIAIVSAGYSNRYGHPHAETLARLDSADVPRVWRTDLQGTLCVEVERNGRWRIRPPS